MGRREKSEAYDTGDEKEKIIAELPAPHRLFFAVFRQAERDIEDFKKVIVSGKAAKMLKEKGWTKKLHWDYTNFKESTDFFSDKGGHLKALADCANVDLSNKQYKERIKINLSACEILHEKLCQLEDQIKTPAKVSEKDQKLSDISVPIIIPEQPGMGCYGGNY